MIPKNPIIEGVVNHGGFVSILGVLFKCVCGIVYLLGGGFKHVLFLPLPGEIYNFSHVLLLCLNS